MISKNEKLEALKNILSSDTFKKATTTNVLLKFLVESTIEEREVNTSLIGAELFGRKYDPEKNDVNVRVNISHLRKRIKQYYEEEGADNQVIISIEPGQYKAAFSKKSADRNVQKKQRFVGTLIVLVAVLAVGIWSFPKQKDDVWGKMFDNQLETTLYLGDVFGYSGPTVMGSIGWHRDSKINSDEDFYSISKKYPNEFDGYSPAQYTYVVFENTYNVKPFTQYFTLNDYDYAIRSASEFSVRSIKDRNTIYAGPIFNKSLFNEMFNDFAHSVELIYDTIPVDRVFLKYTKGSETRKININALSKTEEYAIASAFNGPNNSRHYIFFSNHGMGLTAIVEYFTKQKSLDEFSRKYMEDSDEFIALFHVRGKDRTNISTELVFYDDNK